MILDEEAKPLQRSWCLFELFQTFQLNEQDHSFQFLFCALVDYFLQRSGVADCLVPKTAPPEARSPVC